MKMTVLSYRWNKVALIEILKPFIGGQCQIDKRGQIYRGKVKSVSCSKDNRRRIFIVMEWLCERRPVLNAVGITEQRWFLVTPPPVGLQTIDFVYTVYYYQTDKKRVKLKGWKEFAWFCLPDHPENLSIQDGKYILPPIKK